MRGAVSRAVLCLVLLLPASNALHSQTLAAAERHGAPPEITILLDLSYSMRLPLSLDKDETHGATRLEEAKRLLHTLLDREGTAADWSLLTFGGERVDHNEDTQVRVVQNFTEDTSILKRKIDRLSTWGLSPLRDALLFAERYANRGAPGGRKIILVVSDGIDTVPALYELPSVYELREFSAQLVFAGIDLRRAPNLSAAMRVWMEGAGGTYVDAADPVAVTTALKAALNRRADGQTATEVAQIEPSVASTRAVTGRTDPPRVEHTPSRPFSLPSWLPRRVLAALLLLVLLLPLVLLFARRLRWARACKRARALRRSDVVMCFQRESRGETKQYETMRQRVSLVPRDWERPTSVLPIVEIRDGRAFLSSPGPVVINGVGMRRKSLERGDRIHIPGYLWTFRGMEARTSGPPDPPRPRPLPYLLASSILIVCFLGLLGWQLRSRAPRMAATTSTAVPVAVVPAAAVPVVAERIPEANISLAGDLARVKPYVHTQMISPGRKPAYFKADMMFIHAHPDDVSINFGGLMAMEARAGKRIVSVVFTDGTAGLDQYPYRHVGGIYPARSLSGAALERVRVREEESALSILGSRAYVRLGLRNNPYASLSEILPLREILHRWGGEDHVVGELVRLLEGYRPAIVVSPDRHHYGVFTHFEHEAVGYVTDAALSYLRKRGRNFVRAHLIGVDPMLTGEYHHVFGIDVMRTDPETGLTYRAIQVAALDQHRSQRDASVIAVEVVPNFRDEYYVAQSWNLPTPPIEYFSPPDASAGVPGIRS